MMSVSPGLHDTVWYTDPVSKEKVRVQKMFHRDSIRELHNLLISPVIEGGFAGARNAKGEVQISDTMLRYLMPRCISRMTDSHRQLCGCECCIISKNFVLVLF